MGSLFKTFFHLNKVLTEQKNIEDFYYVTDPSYSESFIKKNKISRTKVVCEYEFLDCDGVQKHVTDPIATELDQLHPLSHAIFADRRLCNDRYSKHIIRPLTFRADIEFEAIKIKAVRKLADFFTEKKPDLVVTHGVATFGMHIIYALCVKHNVRFLNLRHTKIENLMTFDEGLGERYKSILSEMENCLCKEELAWAESYLYETKAGKKFYSGHRFFNDSPTSIICSAPKLLLLSIYRDMKNFIANSDQQQKSFESGAKHSIKWYYEYVRRPINMLQQSKYTIKPAHLKTLKPNEKYVFLPLHAEPEISLSVYARYHLDQVNFVQNIALSLPYNYKLIVKDHPRNKGRRPYSFFKRLSNIQSVTMMDYDADSRLIIDECDVVVMLSGFVGFEALLRNKPVVCFGASMVSNFSKYLPVFPINNFDILHRSFVEVCENEHDFSKLPHYVAAIKRRSEQIEIMSVLLQKRNRHGSKWTPELYDQNIRNLSLLLNKFL